MFMGGDDSKGDAVTDGKACASAQPRHLYLESHAHEGSVMCLLKVGAEPIEVVRPQRCHGSDGSVMERTSVIKIVSEFGNCHNIVIR